MKDLIEYCRENRTETIVALLALLAIVASTAILTTTYGLAGLVLGLSVPVASSAVAYLTRPRRD